MNPPSLHHLYNIWRGMKKRCFCTSDKNYNNYGGRGITVCNRWETSFEDFVSDMGERPSPKHSIDRIDVNGNYEPSNCRWATAKEQQRNRRNNLILTIAGESKKIHEWSKISGISADLIRERASKNLWPHEEAVFRMRCTKFLKKDTRAGIPVEGFVRQMPKLEIGKRYGSLTVIADFPLTLSSNYKRKVLCKCSCGSDAKWILVNGLKTGNTKSCGCIKRAASINNLRVWNGGRISLGASDVLGVKI